MTVNLFHDTNLFLCPMKTLGSLKFPDIFQEV